MTPEEFRAATSVSRETLDRLVAYADLLRAWQRTINLVGPRSVDDMWRRHFLDSAQLLGHIPERARSLIDLGSGAGFPGLVLAILGVRGVHLVESNARKAAFLREAARVTGAEVTVLAQRIEDVPGFPADVVTARALAPIADLFAYAQPFLHAHSLCLFLKGEQVESELTEAANSWYMRSQRWPSLSNPAGCVMAFTAISRAR